MSVSNLTILVVFTLSQPLNVWARSYLYAIVKMNVQSMNELISSVCATGLHLHFLHVSDHYSNNVNDLLDARR